MENKLKSREITFEDRKKKKLRERKIARTRASLVRNQILKAYEILELIRFDFIGDTAFREYIVRAKKELEGSISDYLLDDAYWKNTMNKLRKMDEKEYIQRYETDK